MRKKPSEKELRRLFKKHGQNITAVAATLGMPGRTLYEWYRKIGVTGNGVGGHKKVRPPDNVLRELHTKHNGHFQAISLEMGVTPSAVSAWMRRLGLPGMGKPKYERAYPRELQLSIRDGYGVFFSDSHWWTEERSQAHEALLVAIKKLKPVLVVAVGDLIDGARISRHDPSGLQELPTISDELGATAVHLAHVKRLSGDAETYLVPGNHDARFSRYVARNASEIDGMEGTRLEHHILGWTFAWSLRINDNLLVMHRFRGGQHATYTNALRSGMSIITGHLHSQRVYPFSDARGTRYGVDLGCLAEIHGPQFAYTESNPLDWRSGFGVVEFRDGKMLPPQLVTVLDDGEVWMQRNERLI